LSELNPAVEALMGGRLEDALRACRKAVRARPDHAEAQMLLAEVQQLLGDTARAAESTAQALRLRPGWTPANILLVVGDLYREFGRLDVAESRFRSALALQPELDDARFNLAGLLYASSRRAEAVRELEYLLERHPEAPDVRERLVQLLYEERNVQRLELVCREGLQRFPRAAVYSERLGAAYWFQGRFEAGLEAYARALRLAVSDEERQQSALSTASALFALGRLDEGWKVFQGRYTRAAVVARHPEVIDDPARIAALEKPARILIRTEQGVGDEIFFLRFAVELRRRGHRLRVSGEAKLPPLLAALPELFDAGDGAVDFTLCSGDLPLASGQTIAPPLPLAVDAQRREQVQGVLAAFGPPPYLGVTWRGGLLPGEPAPLRGAFLQKKLPPDALGAALAAADVRVVVLQRKPTTEDMEFFLRGLGRAALDLSSVNDDLRDALAALSLLDDYVGVSNANFHLRAGLAPMSSRVLVSMPADWRWAMEGTDSPWFPGFTVYRRQFGEDWTGVLAGLGHEITLRYGALHQK
jgi:tetratricopeptide (TPR) repeat protein